ncbi:MAG: VOC family protein [Dehalococcoidia bacterium]|nr:VOC family protein [Dehalococcoidia bacterium]
MGSPIVFFQVTCADLERSAAFFHEVFGWEIGPESPGVGASINTHDPVDFALNGALSPAGEGRTPGITIFVRVDNLDDTVGKAEALGGRVLVQRMRTPGGVDIAVILTPDGHRIGVVQQ